MRQILSVKSIYKLVCGVKLKRHLRGEFFTLFCTCDRYGNQHNCFVRRIVLKIKSFFLAKLSCRSVENIECSRSVEKLVNTKVFDNQIIWIYFLKKFVEAMKGLVKMWRKLQELSKIIVEILLLTLDKFVNFSSTMSVRKLHLIIVASLINFGLFLKLDELKYYKPSGEKLERNLRLFFTHSSLNYVNQ